MIKKQFYSRKLLFVFLQLGCFVLLNLFSVQAQVSQEYKVKAAFLYNLGKMVEWPEDSISSDIIICFFGEDSFGNQLDSLKDKSINDKVIDLRRNISLDSVAQCHMLFISDEELDNLEDILAIINGLPVLTIGESETFAERGGIVNLPQVKGRIRIEINLKAAQNAGLKMSSKLLTLAKIIE